MNNNNTMQISDEYLPSPNPLPFANIDTPTEYRCYALVSITSLLSYEEFWNENTILHCTKTVCLT